MRILSFNVKPVDAAVFIGFLVLVSIGFLVAVIKHKPKSSTPVGHVHQWSQWSQPELVPSEIRPSVATWRWCSNCVSLEIKSKRARMP